MKRGYVDLPWGQIHYRTEGRGEALLLLHQSLMSSRDYDTVIPLLSKDYHVVAMDTPGHGNSDDPPQNYQIEDLAGAVIDFLDVLGIKETYLVGHHTGAMIAVEIAAAYSQRVKKLFLSGCPSRYYAPPGSDTTTERPPQTRPSWEFRVTDDGQFLINAWEIYTSIAVPGLSLDKLFTKFVITLRQSIRSYTVPTHQYNIQPRMGLINIPTLLASGSADWFLDELEFTRSLLPRCRTQVIPGYGLFPSAENPKGFAQAILDFLQNPGI